MPENNALLPVLEVAAPDVQWPAELSEAGVSVMRAATADLLRKAQKVAQQVAHVVDHPGKTPEMWMMIWVSSVAATARQVINLSGMEGDDPGNALRDAVTAALTARAASIGAGLGTVSEHDCCIGDDLLRNLCARVEGAARWCRRPLDEGKPQLDEFVELLEVARPPGFSNGGEFESGVVGRDDQGRIFTCWRRRPDRDTDLVRITAEFGVMREITVVHRDVDGAPVSDPVPLTYLQLRELMARAHDRGQVNP